MPSLITPCRDTADERAPLRPGKVSPMREVPAHIPRPPYADSGMLPDWDRTPQIHDAAGIEKMRAAGKLAAQVLEMAGGMVAPGVTTEEIDAAVHKMTIEAGAYPSPLNYGRFPKSVCTSVNECICHGIPDSRALRNGDIINIDVTVYLDVSVAPGGGGTGVAGRGRRPVQGGAGMSEQK
jgi:methionyl aminopeptidase